MKCHVEKQGKGPKPFKVIDDATGEVLGQYATKEKAQAQVAVFEGDQAEAPLPPPEAPPLPDMGMGGPMPSLPPM